MQRLLRCTVTLDAVHIDALFLSTSSISFSGYSWQLLKSTIANLGNHVIFRIRNLQPAQPDSECTSSE